MQQITVEIEGLRPFLFHKFNIESVTALTKIKTGKAGNDPEEWKEGFFHNDGILYLPCTYIFSALKRASFFTKAGKGSIQNTWVSAVTMEEEIVYFNRKIFDKWEEMTPDEVIKDSTQPVYIDIRMVQNPNTKGRNIRYRVALSPKWKLKFSFLLDDSLVSVQQAKKVVEDCGKFVGMSDARQLGYGRFKVVSFEHKKLTEE